MQLPHLMKKIYIIVTFIFIVIGQIYAGCVLNKKHGNNKHDCIMFSANIMSLKYLRIENIENFHLHNYIK